MLDVGTGNLTMKLLERAKKVIAIELDPRMVGSSRTIPAYHHSGTDSVYCRP